MQHIKLLIITFCIASLATTSCKKQLDTTPDTSLTELKNFDDVKSAISGAYAGFKSDSYYGNPASSGTASAWSALPDLMGDDFVEALESLGNWRTMSELTYASDNGIVESTFAQPYEIISRVNNILQTIAKYESGSTAVEATLIKAQAYAIRAHAHFDLLRYFGQEYDRNATALGVPYIKSFNAQSPFANLPRRETVKDNYDNILNDLNEALVNFRLAGAAPANASRNFVDSVVVYAMRTRVNYYAGQWANVISDANIALGLRALGNATTYISTFATASEAMPPSEVFWAIPSDGTMTPGRGISGPNPNYRISAAHSARITAMGGAYVNAGITRFNQTGTGDIERTLCWKYAGIRSFKVFRAGEILLMRAEAKHRSGVTAAPTALADLNTLRTNRGVTTGTETGANLLNAILMMRRVELIGEGHRWFDLRRSTKTINRAECGTSGGSPSSNCTVASNSRSWIFPIPFNDKQVNPNLEQNPGY